MFFSRLKNLFGTFGKRRPAPVRRGKSQGTRVRLGVETLEDRLVMSGFAVLGDQLLVTGTGGSDTLAFTAGATPQVTLNADTFTVDPTQIHSISFDGAGGKVEATLTDDTGGLDYLGLMPGGGTLQGSNYLLSLTGASKILAYGSPNSQANLAGSAVTQNYFSGGQTDAAQGGVRFAYLQSAQNDSYSLAAFNFGYVFATNGTSSDQADLIAPDGFGPNTFARNNANAALYGNGHFVEADGFATVTATAKTAQDVAVLYGSTNGPNTYKHYSDANAGTLSGAGYVDNIYGFSKVDVYAGTALDVATLYAPNAGQNFFSAGTDATGSNYVELFDANNTFDDYLHGFGGVTAWAGTSSDVATLSGARTLKNDFAAAPDSAYVSNASFSAVAYGFDTVQCIATTPADVVKLYGSLSNNNTFTANPLNATLSGYFGNGPAYVETATGFATLDAYAGTSADVAYLFGSPTAKNTFGGFTTTSYMANANYINEANGFQTVYAYASTPADVGYLGGQKLNSQPPNLTEVYGPGYDIQYVSSGEVHFTPL